MNRTMKWKYVQAAPYTNLHERKLNAKPTKPKPKTNGIRGKLKLRHLNESLQYLKLAWKTNLHVTNSWVSKKHYLSAV